MARVIDRIRAWIEVGFKDPDERVERAMVRVLLIGNAALAMVGFFDLIRLRTVQSGVQAVAATLFVLAILWMDRTDHRYPRTLLAVAALAGAATMYAAGVTEDYYRLTDPQPMAFIFSTGFLAMLLGGRWKRAVALAWSAMIIASVAAVRWPVTGSVGQVASDIATILVLLALTFSAAIAVQKARRQGQVRYRQLMDTAPVGIVEVDLQPARSWLLENGYTTLREVRAALDSGEIDAYELTERVVVQTSNRMANADLMLRHPISMANTPGPARRGRLAEIAAQIVFGGATGSFEVTLDVDGVETHRVLNWIADSDDKRSVLVVATDITSQKAAERALSDQIRYKDEFIASVSHELRTPLTAVVGLAEEVVRRDSVIGPEERDELMTIVAEQSREVADLVEDLLVAARAAGGNLSIHPKQLDMGEMVRGILSPWNGAFELHLDAGLLTFADPGRVRQVLRNLTTNAIRYGGPHRRIAAFHRDDFTIVEVRDDGQPIPANHREIMFEPYERTRDQRSSQPESVGLGLTVARSLAEAMGGSVSYEHDGEESVFRLSLPSSAVSGLSSDSLGSR
jgi:signal transduction histidine kinase